MGSGGAFRRHGVCGRQPWRQHEGLSRTHSSAAVAVLASVRATLEPTYHGSDRGILLSNVVCDV